MTNDIHSNDTLLTFPCDFMIKVFGAASDDFEVTVLSIIHKHVPNLPEGAIQSRLSEAGKYRALTITVHVESKEQLDAIYQELTAAKEVLMAL